MPNFVSVCFFKKSDTMLVVTPFGVGSEFASYSTVQVRSGQLYSRTCPCRPPSGGQKSVYLDKWSTFAGEFTANYMRRAVKVVVHIVRWSS